MCVFECVWVQLMGINVLLFSLSVGFVTLVNVFNELHLASPESWLQAVSKPWCHH